MFFGMIFDITLTQPNYVNVGQTHILRLNVFKVMDPDSELEGIHRADPENEYQAQGRWGHYSDNSLPGHQQLTSANPQYLYWRYNSTRREFSFVSIMDDGTGHPYVTIHATLYRALPTYRGLEPDDGAVEGPGYVFQNNYLSTGQIMWSWDRNYGHPYQP